LGNSTTIYDNLLPLVNQLRSAVQGDQFWESYLERLNSPDSVPITLHLAILVEPYLQFILDGTKTVESRFSTRRFAPYNRVEKGDIVLLKKSSGPIVGICQITHAWFYHLDPESWQTLKEDFAVAICAQDPNFWKEREAASFATLMRIQNVKSIEPIKFAKRDRRGWVILYENSGQLQLDLGEL